MIIVISGTPGVGKTIVSKELVKRLNLKYFHLSQFVIDEKLYIEYDEERQSYIIDEDKVKDKLEIALKESDNIVIESIYPSLIPKADIVVVLRKNPIVLYNELKNRGWPELKIAENVEAEILGVISQEAKEAFNGKVCEIDVTKISIDQIINKILNKECDYFIDWLSDTEIQSFLENLDNIISSHENNI
ncbi:adenylate kinase family protein [Saccharolobus caldissimus]|uniref:Putative adenylate kinase n=1 Tax=Saccharolobus caldissimus TaxID=1702097 RepID=A0AAQ4CP20_9CREN|nr:adenylate kinase family protein [Saccharolobus caldissimus]BDB97551.1 adenylate kinase [Saccharolobus caldissimus]